MEITLEKATESDATDLFQMQIDSFSPLLHKYKDYETNPANETIEKTICRINHVDGGFYKIIVAMNLVGAICISQKKHPLNFGSVQCLFTRVIKEKELPKRYLH